MIDYKKLGLSEKDYEEICKRLNRKPNDLEIGLFSAMWSEHCSYRSTKDLLKKLPTSGNHVIKGPGEGAGIIDIGNNNALSFKMESHNHPSAVEPHSGAATGVGGIVRDIFSMGARPVALLNSLRFGSLDSSKNRYLFKNVVRGISDYGNCIGVPTIGGDLGIDNCYEENPLVNVMCIGKMKHEEIRTGIDASPGDELIYVGSATGRDGVNGASFASDTLTAESENNKSPVQLGDPFKEKLLIEACLEAFKNKDIVGVQDMGAAGLTSSSSELAERAGLGVLIHIDKIPLKDSSITPFEIMLSESQERMLFVVKKDCSEKVIETIKKWNLDACVIGNLIQQENFIVSDKHDIKANIKVEDLLNVPNDNLTAEYKAFNIKESKKYNEFNIYETFEKILSHHNVSNKKFIYEQYDSSVQGNTCIPPGNNSGLIKIDDETYIAAASGCNSRYVDKDPKVGTKLSIVKVARNIICSGAKPLAVTNCLNFGNPKNPQVYKQLELSIEGLSEACSELNTPVISGNVSLYNQGETKEIYPTPIIGMVGIRNSYEHKQEIDYQNDVVYIIGNKNRYEFGGSLYNLVTETYMNQRVPCLDLEYEKVIHNFILSNYNDIKFIKDVAEGGLGVTLAKISSIKDYGFSINLQSNVEKELFSEAQTRFVIIIDKKKENLFSKYGYKLGNITKEKKITINDSIIFCKNMIEINYNSLKEAI